MTYWTTFVHESILAGVDALGKYSKELNEQILDIVQLVRGKLTTQNRITLGNYSKTFKCRQIS